MSANFSHSGRIPSRNEELHVICRNGSRFSSDLSNSEHVVSLNAVKNLSADVLHQLLTNVIYTVQKSGFIVVVVIADNYQVNSKAFQAYSGKIPPAEGIENPQHPGSKCFLYDTVHIFKCIRNN